MQRRKQHNQEELKFQVNASIGPPPKEQTAQQISGQKSAKIEGVQINEKQRQYLLPHFTMIIVGKPGSGKTSTIQQMLNSEDFYSHKFDMVLILSPSANKMGIKVKKDNMVQVFDLRWIEDKLFEMNKKQVQAIAARLKELNLIDKFDIESLNGHLMDTVKTDMSSSGNPGTVGRVVPNLYADKERFFTPQIKKAIQGPVGPAAMAARARGGKKGGTDQPRMDIAQYVDKMYQDYYVKLPVEERPLYAKNCLIIFDDMISQIKANEFNPLLTQLIFNRRHLLLGGTISVMIVAQKYTMIPARVRSNANWLLLFRLNPVDFDNVYKDVVMMPREDWERLLEFIFGGVEKKYNNLGIWVETDEYFQNFQHIDFQ